MGSLGLDGEELISFCCGTFFSKVSRASKWLLSVTALRSPSSLMEKSMR